MTGQIVIFGTPFVFQEKGSPKKHEIYCGLAVQERKRWRGVTQAKVLCSFQGKVQSRWINIDKLQPASFSQRYWAYHQLENECVNDPEANWLLPDISTALFIALDKYIPPTTIARATREIKKRYAESHRVWHNEKHVREVLLFLLKHCEITPTWLLLDAIFHDIIYFPGSTTHEEDSANFMRESMRDFDVERRLLMVRMGMPLCQEDPFMYWPKGDYRHGIMATKTHDVSSPSINMLLDADMEVLGSSLNRYRRYARAIRKEFGNFSDVEYINGRTKFLKGLLARPSIFVSTLSTETMESRARQNIQWEITMLQGGQTI
jgi:predicted metal-dependent HD superfamily phosphohydrolase